MFDVLETRIPNYRDVYGSAGQQKINDYYNFLLISGNNT